jgi:hypothetical protein
MDAASDFQSKILSRKRTPEEYRVYLAGLEWDLTDPIVIERAETSSRPIGGATDLRPTSIKSATSLLFAVAFR